MLKQLVNIEKKSDYSDWEYMIARKLNFNSISGIINMIVGFTVFSFTGYPQLSLLTIIAAISLIFINVLNRVLNYLWASYCFFLFGYVFMIFVSLFMGKNTYIIIFFFPIAILLVLTFGRKELFKHLIILSTLLIITQIIIVIGLSYDVLRIEIEDKTENIFMSVNIVMSFISTMFITLLTVKEQLSHEERLRKATRDKELLLAEVFHRVKNNLNIVTSILNLKKNMSEDTSVQEAIEECRGRIYSMALVHETIFNNKREIGLKLDEYIKRLAIDISNGLGIEDLYHLEIEMDQVEINLTTAVPCGMIVNELLTNVFKHAKQKDQLLMINISLKKYDTYFVLTIQDNGPGMNIDGTKESLSLGMELIASLAEQMNTSGEFYTNNGLVFTMKVPIVG